MNASYTWLKAAEEDRLNYIKYLKAYASLSLLFKQKNNNLLVPYVDSKFQETIYAKSFKSINATNVDLNNTPHDIMTIVDDQRVGLALKTWMGFSSYQKIMQLKSYSSQIKTITDSEEMVFFLSSLRNQKLLQDYNRLGLNQEANAYHLLIRQEKALTIYQSPCQLIDIENITDISMSSKSLSWSDKKDFYKFTFADSQMWKHFDLDCPVSNRLARIDAGILKDPFTFLKDLDFSSSELLLNQEETYEVFLPLYSYKSKEVPNASGLNAWNSKPKNTSSNKLRPLNEIYIPIPQIFHKMFPDFFCPDIELAKEDYNVNKKPLRFFLHLPNGKIIPALLTQANFKSLQSGSENNLDENNLKVGQSALGQWLLIDVLGLNERTVLTREWLKYKDIDSIKLCRNQSDYANIYIDLAPYGAFENFISQSIEHRANALN